MFTTPFWPAADSYPIHMMDIPLPESLSPVALDLIHQATRLAEAACIPLRWLTELPSLNWNGAHYVAELSAVKPALTALATAMTPSALQGDIEAAQAFLQRYSPHHQREAADLLLHWLGKTVDMIDYDQKSKGLTL